MSEQLKLIDCDSKKGFIRRDVLKCVVATGLAAVTFGDTLPTVRESPAGSKKESEPDFGMTMHAEALLGVYKSNHRMETKNGFKPVDAHSLEIMQQVMHCISKHLINNTKVYLSTKNENVAFPLTSISLKEVAEEVFTKLGLKKVSESPTAEKSTQPVRSRVQSKLEFFIPGWPSDTTSNGPLDWTEFSIHNIIKLLPAALADIAAGREVFYYRICNLGYLTNEFGHVPGDIEQQIERDGVRALSVPYTEYITEQIASSEVPYDSLALTSHSLGASIAPEIAKDLLRDNIARQLPASDASKVPSLSVTLYSPVSVVDAKSENMTDEERESRKRKIRWGFIKELLREPLVNPGARRILSSYLGGFDSKIRGILESKGIVPNMDNSQKDLKNSAIDALKQTIYKGSVMPKDLKVTMVPGLRDSMMYSEDRAAASESEKKKQVTIKAHDIRYRHGRDADAEVTVGHTLGTAILPREDADQRIFGINEGHMIQLYNKNRFRPFDALVRAVDIIKKSAVGENVR